jgi:hypothetical protein
MRNIFIDKKVIPFWAEVLCVLFFGILFGCMFAVAIL